MTQPFVFETAGYRAIEITDDRVARLQRFLEENPEYYVAVNGEPPGPGEAREEVDSLPPAEWPMEKKWVLDFAAGDGTMAGMANVISNLLADRVWHIGLFIVATRLHGAGAARVLYDGLEAWMRANGARWLRLGVVIGNARGERFWEKVGYREVRKRLGVEMGRRTNDLRVMVKPLGDASIEGYLARVPRDRTETALDS